MATISNRRDRRSRAALIEAFNQLLSPRRRERVRVSDLVARADSTPPPAALEVSDDRLMEALLRPFAILADAAVGRGDADRLAELLGHFWANRQRARASLVGRTGDKAVRLLADMVEARLKQSDATLDLPTRLAALQLAQAALAPIRGWVGGEATCDAATLAEAIRRTGKTLVASLTADPGR